MRKEQLQDRLLRIAEYHSLEWAERLKEVGGLGVGGTELAYYPRFVQRASNEDEYIGMALEASIPQTWEEAAWCYVYGQYRACILLCATLLEIALKYELYRKGQSVSSTLGPLIDKCLKVGILTGAMTSVARSINLRRNDVIHANIQTNRPESLLHYAAEEHEIEPVEDLSRNLTSEGSLTGDGETISISFAGDHLTYSRDYAFKRAARASLFDVRTILKSLYPPSERENTQGEA